MDNANRLLKPIEAASILGISRTKVYELMARKVIPTVSLDGSVRVPAAQLQLWIEEQIREQASVQA